MTETKKQTSLQAAAAASSTNAVQKAQRVQFQAIIKNANVQQNIMSTLGDAAKAKTFTSSLISAVSTNPQLRECEGMSIISAALLGESLNLSPSPQLGQYYMVPFKDTKSGTTKATFQLGWKGYYQLALRSGQYRNIDAVAIKEGELEHYDPITGEIKIAAIEDPIERENAKTVGYYAYFELLNGFKKAMYWPKEKMEAHALKYSMGYRAKKGYTFWEKDFDGMALKTMYRQLISKYGIMSIDMQKAFVNDMTVQTEPEASGEAAEAPIYFDAETGEVTDA